MGCFEGKISLVKVLIDEVSHSVASWVSPLHHFKDFPIPTIMSNWKEVAPSSIVLRQIRSSWSPQAGYYKLNLMVVKWAIRNERIGGIIRYCFSSHVILFNHRGLFNPSG